MTTRVTEGAALVSRGFAAKRSRARALTEEKQRLLAV